MGTKRAHPVGSLDENPKDLQKVLMAVSRTREEEISCDGCFERTDRFVEAGLSGLDAAGAMPLVEDHLQKCGDCREEFEALLGALRAEEGSGPVGWLWSRLRRSLGSGLPEEKRMDDDQDLRATRRGSAARKRARHRHLPQLRRLRPLLHEEIRTVVSFDENLARAGRKATGFPLWRPDCTRTSLGEPWSRYAHAVVES